ncbi:MAG: hypothetical protein H7Y27_04995 [Gemmatimonadaceae bacterium]|nr:hypothetical protein [Chitinophagaceae bacterium]
MGFNKVCCFAGIRIAQGFHGKYGLRFIGTVIQLFAETLARQQFQPDILKRCTVAGLKGIYYKYHAPQGYIFVFHI